ncbi:glucose-6-phosphate dehydrogenase assembly protein OpcA [Sphaerisporangium krabiense]|uniref:Glucose-6-phosphate dehydrogenase assembly protein OpcA n=1 Tax=Sphaerisporangium krabiense TaxID=763782 RepID=A0A7W8ZC68_9ACTN|nr:glucose-6-phosphate dehydrogenase assembly protein OpcA [Sphaerisporangium krabiense]MBB5630988.1 glucose-6-phosphate dehydrogenase assembly protein OpcA [Sphaerisporangium krabiense]GII65870.1 glucose-6-phosphate dehydrogenase assembly protein OpcA [Sphaerisporangium krabiense]
MTSFLMSSTTASEVAAQLTRLRHQLGAPAVGMVLTIVVVCDESHQYDAVRAASEASREHPSRILAVIPREREEGTRLDAELRVGELTTGEVVLLRLYGELTEHADSVLAPLLLTDIPVVVWWPGDAPQAPAKDPVGAFGQRRVTDARSAPDQVAAIKSRIHGYSPGDTDLTWTRITAWRSLLAAAFDQPVGEVIDGYVEGEAGHPSACLLAVWLSSKLDAPIRVAESKGPGLTTVRLRTNDGEVIVERHDSRTATLKRPGQPDRQVALARRSTAELLAEELRRLDPDEVYEETIRGVAAL